jgi:two-component system cell cycle response regulator
MTGGLVVLGLAVVALGAVAVLLWLRAAQQQAAIAAAHEREAELTHQVEQLQAEAVALREAAADVPIEGMALVDAPPDSLTDSATGLFNEQFFRVTLDTRVSAARRHLRPVAVVLLRVASGVREGTPADVAPVLVANGVRSTLRDADTACRLDDGSFALILEDTPENGAVWTVERVRRALALEHPGQTLWAGIACYPAHAFDAWELFERSRQALTSAREWHQDRIEVATSE